MILPHQRLRAWTWGHLFSKSLSFSHFRWVYFFFLFAITESYNCPILVNVICRDGAPTDKVRPLSFSALAVVKSISLNETPLGYLVHWVDSIQKEYVKLCLLLFICYLRSVFFSLWDTQNGIVGARRIIVLMQHEDLYAEQIGNEGLSCKE